MYQKQKLLSPYVVIAMTAVFLVASLFSYHSFVLAQASCMDMQVFVDANYQMNGSSVNGGTISPSSPLQHEVEIKNAGTCDLTLSGPNMDWYNYDTLGAMPGTPYKGRMAEDGSGKIWVSLQDNATDPYGVGVYDPLANVWSHHLTGGANTIPDNAIFDIFADNLGNIWVATDSNGVGKYDYISGTWTTYNTSNSGIIAGTIIKIDQDMNGNMWFAGSSTGLSMYDGASWTTYDTSNTGSNGLPNNNIQSIFVDSGNNLWVYSYAGPDGTIVKYDPSAPSGSQWTQIYTNFPYTMNIKEDANGDMWFAGRNLHKSAGSSWVTYYPPGFSSSNDFTTYSLEITTNGDIWIGSYIDSYGVFVYTPTTNSWENYTVANTPTYPNTLGADNLTSILRSSTGTMWFGTMGGLTQLNNSLIPAVKLVGSDYSLSGIIPADGTVVIPSGGLASFYVNTVNMSNGSKYASLEIQSDDSSNPFYVVNFETIVDDQCMDIDVTVNSVSQSNGSTVDAGPIVIGSSASHAVQIHNTGMCDIKLDGPEKTWFTRYSGNSTFPNVDMWDLGYTSNGHIWMGTNGYGLYEYDPVNDSFTQYSTGTVGSSNILHDSINFIFVDDDDNIWLSYYAVSFGLTKYNTTTHVWTTYNTINSGIYSDTVNKMFVNSDGDVWAVHSSGYVSVFTPSTNSWVQYNPSNSLLQPIHIQSIYEDSNRVMWFGYLDFSTNGVGSGLTSFDLDATPGSQWSHIAGVDVPFSSTMDIVEDSHGQLWFASADSLYVYNSAAPLGFQFGAAYTPSSAMSNPFIPSLMADNAGHLWLSYLDMSSGSFVGDGVFMFDTFDYTWEYYTLSSTGVFPDSLGSNTVYSITQTPDNSYWFTTDSGLTQLSETSMPAIEMLGAEYSLSGSVPMDGEVIVSAGSTAVFNVDIDTTSAGIYSGLMTILSDDPDENPYTINFETQVGMYGDYVTTGSGFTDNPPVPDGVLDLYDIYRHYFHTGEWTTNGFITTYEVPTGAVVDFVTDNMGDGTSPTPDGNLNIQDTYRLYFHIVEIEQNGFTSAYPLM